MRRCGAFAALVVAAGVLAACTASSHHPTASSSASSSVSSPSSRATSPSPDGSRLSTPVAPRSPTTIHVSANASRLGYTLTRLPGDQPYDVSCATPTTCLADDGGSGEVSTLGYWQRTGTRWSGLRPVGTESPSAAALSCGSTTSCVMFANKQSSEYAFVWNGSAWSRPTPLVDPSPLGAAASLPNISCVGESWCMAEDGTVSWVYRAGSWSKATALPNLSNKIGVGELACASSRFCLVAQQHTTDVWDGTRWTAHRGWPLHYSPYPMACAAPHFCLGAAARSTSTSPDSSATWNGSGWSAPTRIPVPTARAFVGVACPRASFCVGLNAGGDELVYRDRHWGTWHALGVGNFHAEGNLSCPTTTSCTFADYDRSGVVTFHPR